MEGLWSISETSEVPFEETAHGRLRRRQRGIDKKDLKSALKYGERRSTHPRPNGNRAGIYTYKDITYIVDEMTGAEVTSYAAPLTLDPVPITASMQQAYRRAKARLQSDLSTWTSNTVMIVDVSGSMKEGDMWGTRNRLGAVWVSIALDYLAGRLESGNACETDVISVVTMGDNSQVVIEEEPSCWVLYNKIISIYSEAKVKPFGHGMFIPSLEVARNLLERNSSLSCVLCLTFLTDGIPSDHMSMKYYTKDEVRDRIVKTVSSLARKHGRRLTFTAIGIGDYDDFKVLREMVDQAEDFGTEARFCLPSKTSSSLAETFSSIASSVTESQEAMRDGISSRQRQVRAVYRETKSEATKEIRTIAEVSHKFGLFRKARVKRQIYKEWHNDLGRKKYSYEDVGLHHPNAQYVAMCQEAFGEGKERFAFRFFELSSDGLTIVGKPLVAKQSRHVIETGSGQREFVKSFVMTQQLSCRLAKEFNDKMNSLRRIDPATPRVRMLDCSIYHLTNTNGEQVSVLVEERLEIPKWHKWNGNGGYVEGMEKKPDYSDSERLRSAFLNLDRMEAAIEEGSEEDSDDEGENGALAGRAEPIIFSASQVAHAFSHFTYWASGRKRLVCDIQGVFDEESNQLVLSDPAMHYNDPNIPGLRLVYGHTDMGREGMARFFDTHHEHCGHLCKLVNRGLWRAKRHNNRPNTFRRNMQVRQASTTNQPRLATISDERKTWK